VFWDDITSNLPSGSVYGVAVDRGTGAIYIAAQAGIFMTYTDTYAAAPGTPWTRLNEGPAFDVLLDSGGNQLYAAIGGSGIFATVAPHRLRDPRVVSAADRNPRPLAPGALVSVVGAKVQSARAGQQRAPVLADTASGSEVQVPFEAAGEGLILYFESQSGRFQVGLPLHPAAPAIFVDRDGNPVITNADTGLVLDSATPARPGMRLQILLSGLGRVTPDWPNGVAAPLENAPKVVVPVRAFMDGELLPVTKATLAPGHIGLYLVEVQLPSILNAGLAELFIEAAGAFSNKVRLATEP
jgi:uncharacterized protein (TIGR03437 family)